ncbi:aldo/keto reductase [Sphingobium bisphenolivorans]|uniref:aldo/keto reductase n=1 Tax=Sphingobium bisphenolivorans TaxID=1335760 RepID=UPI00039CE445|nr:aldo/keto reductase [Sphingobium bisphenolivorans]
MEIRTLGRSGLRFAPLMFGGNVLGWTMDRPTSFRVLDEFLDAGFSAIDTADVYAPWTDEGVGTSERVLGEWFALGGGRRERVMLATKVGLPMARGKKGLSRAYIMEAIDASLARLRTTHIDLYLAHCDDPKTPLAETLDAFAELIRAGKVRAVGASNMSAGRVREALAIADRIGLPRFEAVQPLYNLYDRRDYESDMQALAVEQDLGVIPFFALASGFLTGKYRSAADLRPGMRGELVGKYLDTQGQRLLDVLDAVAARHDAVPAQIALAWLLTKPGITAPIASATSVGQLQQLIKACDIDLTDDDIAALDGTCAEMEGGHALTNPR